MSNLIALAELDIVGAFSL